MTADADLARKGNNIWWVPGRLAENRWVWGGEGGQGMDSVARPSAPAPGGAVLAPCRRCAPQPAVAAAAPPPPPPPRPPPRRVPAVRGDAGGYGDDWRTLVLQDRGHWDENNALLFPRTAQIVKDLNGGLDSALDKGRSGGSSGGQSRSAAGKCSAPQELVLGPACQAIQGLSARSKQPCLSAGDRCDAGAAGSCGAPEHLLQGEPRARAPNALPPARPSPSLPCSPHPRGLLRAAACRHRNQEPHRLCVSMRTCTGQRKSGGHEGLQRVFAALQQAEAWRGGGGSSSTRWRQRHCRAAACWAALPGCVSLSPTPP